MWYPSTCPPSSGSQMTPPKPWRRSSATTRSRRPLMSCTSATTCLMAAQWRALMPRSTASSSPSQSTLSKSTLSTPSSSSRLERVTARTVVAATVDVAAATAAVAAAAAAEGAPRLTAASKRARCAARSLGWQVDSAGASPKQWSSCSPGRSRSSAGTQRTWAARKRFRSRSGNVCGDGSTARTRARGLMESASNEKRPRLAPASTMSGEPRSGT
mmetsp:Transcript_20644/g.64671  ORF Transcript_20644/g.64671 Transcript_20644/m.64671 type:complete len:215 (-) Transcript_20644:237-881(-)